MKIVVVAVLMFLVMDPCWATVSGGGADVRLVPQLSRQNLLQHTDDTASAVTTTTDTTTTTKKLTPITVFHTVEVWKIALVFGFGIFFAISLIVLSRIATWLKTHWQTYSRNRKQQQQLQIQSSVPVATRTSKGFEGFVDAVFPEALKAEIRRHSEVAAVPKQETFLMKHGQKFVTLFTSLFIAMIKYGMEAQGTDPAITYIFFSQVLATVSGLLGELLIFGTFFQKGVWSWLWLLMFKYFVIAAMDTFVSLSVYMLLLYSVSKKYTESISPYVLLGLTLFSNTLTTVGYVLPIRAQWALDEKNKTIWRYTTAIVLTVSAILYGTLGLQIQRYMTENTCVVSYNKLIETTDNFCTVYTHSDMKSCRSFCGKYGLKTGDEDICKTFTTQKQTNSCGSTHDTTNDLIMATGAVGLIISMVTFGIIGLYTIPKDQWTN
eukprot:c6409_g1_i1.p1 GENE.c6409_g1_i1~~c6409_g1_i1.p1  ORF type:complete len:450 (+),score=110.12 c6409_g1_i1:47-1351(+)